MRGGGDIEWVSLSDIPQDKLEGKVSPILTERMFCSRVRSTQMESFHLVWREVVSQYNGLLRVTFDKTKIIKDHWYFATISKETIEPRNWERDAYLLVLNPNKIAYFFLMLSTETSGKKCYFFSDIAILSESLLGFFYL